MKILIDNRVGEVISFRNNQEKKQCRTEKYILG